MRKDWAEAVAAFYRGVDAEIAERRPVCRGCGECCHFEREEHLLYASRLEHLFLLAAAVPPEAPDADPAMLSAGLRCPFQVGGRCHARAARTLGCRLHFCAWPDPGEAEEMAERQHQALKRLHDALGVEWSYAPLLPLIRP